MKSWRVPILGITLMCLGAVSGAAQIVIPLGEAPQDQPSPDASEKTLPAAPTKLQALAVRTNRIFLVWQDNSNNESNFRVEMSTGGGPFTELTPPVPANTNASFVAPLNPTTTYVFRVRASNADGFSAYSNQATATTRTSEACSVSEMCLNNNRFRIQALYQTTGDLSGEAHPVKLTTDSGYLWFFADTNIEAVVKVLNACGSASSRYWVFAAGLTNVRVSLAVTDTQVGATKVYLNPLNLAFPPIQDTDAFATCP